MQTDVICCGRDLAECVENDHVRHRWHATDPVTRLPFWDHIIEPG